MSSKRSRKYFFYWQSRQKVHKCYFMIGNRVWTKYGWRELSTPIVGWKEEGDDILYNVVWGVSDKLA